MQADTGVQKSVCTWFYDSEDITDETAVFQPAYLAQCCLSVAKQVAVDSINKKIPSQTSLKSVLMKPRQYPSPLL